MTNRAWYVLAAVILPVTIAFLSWRELAPTNARTLNVLSWPGYDEPELNQPFEQKYGVRINFKTYVGGDQMYALLTQSKGVYDAVVVDAEFVKKLNAIGKLSALNPADYDLSDYFAPFQKFELAFQDGTQYAIVVRWGSNGLVYNTKRFTEAEAATYATLFSEKAKGRVGIWDWYLPSMGVIAKSLGFKDAYSLTTDQFNQVHNELRRLRPQVAAFYGTLSEMTTALGNDQVWMIPAAGAWVAAVVQAQGKPVDWSVPKEGGIMWTEALTIPSDAPHPSLAEEYVRWMTTPEAQALLAMRRVGHNNVPNRKAYQLMSPELREELKILSDQDALDLIAQLSVRDLPTNQPESQWQSVWEQFKAGYPK
jgi:spermidine/putrescine transport system substrate-binding protein